MNEIPSSRANVVSAIVTPNTAKGESFAPWYAYDVLWQEVVYDDNGQARVKELRIRCDDVQGATVVRDMLNKHACEIDVVTP
jgi:hypothetical protein